MNWTMQLVMMVRSETPTRSFSLPFFRQWPTGLKRLHVS